MKGFFIFLLGLLIGLAGGYFFVVNAADLGIVLPGMEQEEVMEEEEEPVEEVVEEEEPVVVEGYVFDPEFKSLNGVVLSDEFLAEVEGLGGSITNFKAPYDAEKLSLVYLAVEFVDGETSETNTRIYRYDLITTDHTQVYEYISSNVESPSHLRPLATDGDKLIVLREPVDNSPGQCTSVWEAGEVLYFDLTDDERELFVYEIPESVQEGLDRSGAECKFFTDLAPVPAE